MHNIYAYLLSNGHMIGPFGTQLPAESVSSSFSSNVTSFGNSGVTGARSNKYSNPSLSANNPSPLSFVNPTVLSGAPVLSSNAAEQASVNVQLMLSILTSYSFNPLKFFFFKNFQVLMIEIFFLIQLLV